MRYSTTLGMEFTFLPQTSTWGAIEVDSALDRVSFELAKARGAKNRRQMKGLYKSGERAPYDDDGAVEVPSPIVRTEKQLMDFARMLWPITKKYALSASAPWTNGGGGHVHCGIPAQFRQEPRLRRLMETVLRDMARRPYLNWVFTEPLDYGEATPIVAVNCENVSLIISGGLTIWGGECGLHTPRYAAAARNDEYNTIEFRFFEAPETPQHAARHALFASKYFAYLLRQTKHGVAPVTAKEIRQIRRMKPKEGLIEFRKLLRQLGINPRPYMKRAKFNALNRTKRSMWG